jgi:long-chain-acyl-CoA dehydrogenase
MGLQMCGPVLMGHGTEAQKAYFLPRILSGEHYWCQGYSEPGAGSDLAGLQCRAVRDGDDYVINGTKIWTTHAHFANWMFLLVRTRTAGKPQAGISFLLVDMKTPGLTVGPYDRKMGQRGSHTADVIFDNVRVPAANIIGGQEGMGFIYLMSELPQERLSIAVSAQASAQKAFDETVEFCRDRKAFGKPVLDFQNTRFVLADLKSKLQVGWAHLDWALARHLKKELTAEEGAAAKLWHTELQWEVMDKCLQLHGGAGYMNEYAIARAWRGARVTRIFGGTNEIMKELIGRKL